MGNLALSRTTPVCPIRDTSVNLRRGPKTNPRLGVEFGLHAQEEVKRLLRRHGCHVRRASYGCPFDLLLDGVLRVEIKAAKLQFHAHNGPIWRFNIHRHGKLKETTTDWYVLRLEEIPFHKDALHFAFRSPIGKHTLGFNLRNLIRGKGADAVNDFERLCRGEFSVRPVAEQESAA